MGWGWDIASWNIASKKASKSGWSGGSSSGAGGAGGDEIDDSVAIDYCFFCSRLWSKCHLFLQC
ncbi:MAG: hypothetical protein LBD60_01510 [Puniceicoccales bacterium]|nr:hypothetical protein [Puniceicoccales bacterium]